MLLISPDYNRKQKLGEFSRYVPISVPIGIGYLAGYLIKQGKTAKILDEEITAATGEVLDGMVRDLEKPYIFGFSCLTAGIGRAHELAGFVKKRYPGSVVVFGNIHPTVLPDGVLKDGNVDIVVRGEGEETLAALYERIKGALPYDDIKGISFRRGGAVVHNESAPLPDLKSIPAFPYHLFERHSGRYELGFVASSRGCPYDCMFCSQRSISGKKYRFFPSEVVIESLDELISKYGRTCVTFTDDSFLMNKSRVFELCDLIQKRGYHKKAIFDCQARGDTVDPKILKALRDSGFRAIHFGIETASDRLMEMIDKKETVRQICDGIKLAKDAGFQVSGTFILGLPTETAHERAAAYRLAKDAKLDYVRFNNATPYPGTRLYEIAMREKRFTPGANWENLNACGTLVASPFKPSPLAYVPLTANAKDLMYDILKYNLYFSFNPQRVYRILKERVGPAGWLALPEKWYLIPREWLFLVKFGCGIAFSFCKVLLYDGTSFLRRRNG